MASGAGLRQPELGRRVKMAHPIPAIHHCRLKEQVARRQSSPVTGKLSARPAGKPGDFFLALENLRRSLPRHCSAVVSHVAGALHLRFEKAWRNLSVRWRASLSWSYHLPQATPDPSPRTCREDRALLIVRMSSGRLFLDRGARQHCPSPLHRRTQNNMHFPAARAKGDISTLPGTRHFYFALTGSNYRLPFSSRGTSIRL